MINATFFCINIILLISVWHFMLKKTILDYYRDQLFDLRDEVRGYYIKNGISLDSPSYRNLRDLLNAQLRFTERITFIKFIFLEVEVNNNKGLQKYLKDVFDLKFKTDDAELNAFITQVRGRSKLILLNHMVNSSGLIWLLAAFMSPFIISWNVFRIFKHAISDGVTILSDHLFRSLILSLKFIFAINTPFGKTVKRDFLEEYSFRIGSSGLAAAPC